MYVVTRTVICAHVYFVMHFTYFFRPGLFERMPAMHSAGSAEVVENGESRGEIVAPKLAQPEPMIPAQVEEGVAIHFSTCS